MISLRNRPGLRASLIIGAGALSGFAVSTLEGFYVFPIWAEVGVGLRRPVAEWLISVGLGSIAGKWALVWLNTPEWGMGACLGVLLGIGFRSRWLLAAVPAGFSLAFVWSIVAWIDIFPAFSAFVAYSLVWDAVSLGIVIGFAYLGNRWMCLRCCSSDTQEPPEIVDDVEQDHNSKRPVDRDGQ